jgi:hypothetical protein
MKTLIEHNDSLSLCQLIGIVLCQCTGQFIREKSAYGCSSARSNNAGFANKISINADCYVLLHESLAVGFT